MTRPHLGITNSLALEIYNELLANAFHRSGRSFTSHSCRMSVTPMLARILHDAGFQTIEQQPYILDYSFGTAMHKEWVKNLTRNLKLIEPFLMSLRTSTYEDLETLYQQALLEMWSSEFCAILYLLSVWGKKLCVAVNKVELERAMCTVYKHKSNCLLANGACDEG